MASATGRVSIAEHLFDEISFPVCSPRYANGKLPARPADLAHHLLLRSDSEFWKPWFEAAGLDWPEPARGPIFNDSSHMLQAAAEGQGIALARSSLLGNDLHSGVLVRLFDVVVPAQRKYFLVYPPRLAQAPKLARSGSGSMTKWPPSVPSRRGRRRPVRGRRAKRGARA